MLPGREDSRPGPFVQVQRELTCPTVLGCALALMIEQVVKVLPHLVVRTHLAWSEFKNLQFHMIVNKVRRVCSKLLTVVPERLRKPVP